jgi:hypothetical protein
MQRVLSFEQTPPLSVPLRFFLTAPAFAVAAAALLLWHGPQALASRWTPVALALTHLLTLGFLALSMVGALLQILPVVAGVEIPRARTTASGIHLLLALGAAVLPVAFLLSAPLLFKAALLLLLPAFGWLLGACSLRLWKTDAANPTVGTVRLALLALAVAVGLGGTAASTFAWPLGLPLARLANLHVAWSLPGWVGLLIAGVAYQVIPMFQVTPSYPKTFARHLGWLLFVLLGLWTVAQIFPDPRYWPAALPSILAGGGYAAFAVTTLYLLWKRKRPRPEATTMFWCTGLISLLCCTLLWVAGEAFPQVATAPVFPFALGILFIIGFGYSAINGMLYKIVPFLIWYHLQNQLVGGPARAPNVRQILSDRAAERQFIAHVIALLSLLAAAVWPDTWARLAAIAFMTSSCWVWINLAGCMSVYRTRLQAHAAKVPAAASPA